MRCWFGHAYKPVSARPVEVSTDFGGGFDGTAMLVVCGRCGKPSTRTVKGTWTLEQLRGEQR